MSSVLGLRTLAFCLMLWQCTGLFAETPNPVPQKIQVNRLEEGGFIGTQIEFLRDSSRTQTLSLLILPLYRKDSNWSLLSVKRLSTNFF